MNHQERPIIVGAGPVGLGAALFLAQQGQPVRLVEERAELETQSRALAVNPRTLDLLEPTGVTRRMLEIGAPIHGARISRHGHVVAALSLAGIHPRYPFMLALSQATTERLLTQALHEAGGSIERGLKLVGCRNAADGVEATLEPTAGGARETARYPWLLAAEGAHSVARQQLGIDFVGTSLKGEWYLADVPLRTPLAADHGHVIFLDDGFLFLIRVVDDALKDRPGDPIWRVISTRPGPLSQLVGAEQTGPSLWESSFHISHRINATLAAGHVYFAGDAAHVHSPMGARGMNLGLEDAWVFARLAASGRLAEYDRLRRPVDRQVVRQVELLTRIVSGESALFRFVRSFVLPLAVSLPFTRRTMIGTLTGLDHELPPLSVETRRGGKPATTAPEQRIGV